MEKQTRVGTTIIEFDISMTRSFETQNNLGGLINYGDYEDGATCYAGEKPGSFLPGYQGRGNYEPIAKGSGYFLRNENGDLSLAGYD